ncbi:MAG TPA: hypothetical protein VHD84_03115 [Candidatus Saccharimonadales bacterium]|nr:hypothetical protein [Candidatus Saccharimonadales bacterium]
MNPNRVEGQANFELPPQGPPTPESGERRQEQAAEAPPARQEQAGKQAPQPALPAIPQDIPAVDQPVIAAPPQDDTAAITTPDPHQSAKDSDRIEPAWVHKAKAVIAKTQDDPYTQKNEMSRIKAEYIQKRFNKNIKTDEAPA